MEVFNPFIFVYDVSKVSSIILFKNYLFINFLVELDLHCYAWAFSSCNEQGLLFFAMHRLLIAVASLVQHKL